MPHTCAGGRVRYRPPLRRTASSPTFPPVNLYIPEEDQARAARDRHLGGGIRAALGLAAGSAVGLNLDINRNHQP